MKKWNFDQQILYKLYSITENERQKRNKIWFEWIHIQDGEWKDAQGYSHVGDNVFLVTL